MFLQKQHTRLNSALLMMISGMLIIASCSKSSAVDPAPVSTKLSYGDSIFYIGTAATDLTVAPLNGKSGNYSAFPNGLSINNTTGVINISQSEAGMRYRVKYKGTNNDSASCFIVIAGINFPDKYYRLANADSIAFPVYNSDPRTAVPAGIFDEDKVANSSGCAMRTNNGQINLTESIRNGLFGRTPKNDTRKDFEIKYRLEDKSNKALNKIKILLYYYDTMNDVPADLKVTVQEHQAMTFQPDNTLVLNSFQAPIDAKPRPPCIIIIGHN